MCYWTLGRLYHALGTSTALTKTDFAKISLRFHLKRFSGKFGGNTDT